MEATLRQGKKTLELIEAVPSERYQRLLGSSLLSILLDCPNPELVDKQAFQQVLASAVPKKPIESLLEFLGVVTISATTEKFVARDHFIVDKSKKAKVKISGLGSNFSNEFLDKIEEPIGESILRYHKLRRAELDGPIIAELGGEEKAETTLAEMFASMEKQANGKRGKLLTNGHANIFYIRNAAGVLRAVICYWRGDGWGVYANSIEGPDRWSASYQVFSRNSSKS